MRASRMMNPEIFRLNEVDSTRLNVGHNHGEPVGVVF